MWVLFMKMKIRLERKRMRPERNGKEQNGKERNGKERKGTERNGKERKGTERNRTEQNRTEQNRTEQNRTEESVEEVEGPRWGFYWIIDASEEDVERAKKLVMHVYHPFLLVKAEVSKDCRIKKSNHFIKCGCIRKIKDDHAHADEYLLAVALMTKKEQDAMYKELMNGCDNHSRGYNLRISNDKRNGYIMYLCMKSLLNLVAIGRKRFTNLSMTHFLPDKNKQKNNVNRYCALTQDVVYSVLTFIRDKVTTE
jgi:hypothetical protein